MAGDESEPKAEEATEKTKDKPRRSIPGNLPYTTSPGVLKRVVEKIPVSEKPPVFSRDFLGTVMGATGGSAMPVIPILKRLGFLNDAGVPTETYSQFQSEGGRPQAALAALRHGYGEIFKRNQYAHKLSEDKVADIVIQITGLPKSDPIVRLILNTFAVFQEFAKNAESVEAGGSDSEHPSPESPKAALQAPLARGALGLSYVINLVLPESTNIEVFNTIFRSLKENLLHD